MLASARQYRRLHCGSRRPGPEMRKRFCGIATLPTTCDRFARFAAFDVSAREAVREFKRRGVAREISAAAGKLVFMSSVHQEIPWAGHANYAASKGGVMQLMRSIAQEVAPFAVRANAVAPGAIRTPINRSAWETSEAYRDLMTLVPYRRIGEPEDIAQAVAWLVSDMADYVTGATLFVDGGMTLFPGFATGG